MESHILSISSLFDDESFSSGAICRLADIEGTCCYCSPASAGQLRRRTAHIPVRALHWIDSGDYHYLTILFLERLKTPFRLELIDNHPDDQEPSFFSPGMLSCGGWVRDARRLPLYREGGDCPVYLSIDLDFLSEEVFETDWDQGSATYEDLLSRIIPLAGSEVAGIDICGGITRAQGASDAVLARNRSLRERLALDIARILH